MFSTKRLKQKSQSVDIASQGFSPTLMPASPRNKAAPPVAKTTSGLAVKENNTTNSQLRSPRCGELKRGYTIAACKTYCESIRRSFRSQQPDLASQAEAVRNTAPSGLRRKRLLKARQCCEEKMRWAFWKAPPCQKRKTASLTRFLGGLCDLRPCS